ncbi:PAS domain-containing protein [Kordiimonas sp. SCSIO 12610]|uniref:PAS domain-containing protein n=1 Tax=Kordiimonas sp. SCSIO 12610 TaxID=2829597 RepID=UPI00210A92D4|nr:PAS domain-containing protein [Kordiimonas sp. SCSIO 12610]UTW56236.1 PAS domain-containing protein [Kordiimonas sp. SCSIO 12610]
MTELTFLKDAKLEGNPRYEYGVEVFQSLLSYWRALYAEQDKIPSRSQFHPGELKKILRYVYMTEQRPDGTFHLRHKGTGLEVTERSSFISSEHIQNFTRKFPGALEAYFDTLFAGPCAEESRWIYFSKADLVIDYVCYSLPLYGTTTGHRIALGIVIPSTRFDKEVTQYCDGVEHSRFVCSRYKDIGFGLPEGALQ